MSDNPSWTTITTESAQLNLPESAGLYKWLEIYNAGPDIVYVNLGDEAEVETDGSIEIVAKTSIIVQYDLPTLPQAISAGTSKVTAWARRNSDVVRGD